MRNRLVALLAIIALVCEGCDAPPPSQKPTINKTSAGALVESQEIVPGVGITSFRIGVSQADAISIEEPSKVVELESSPDMKWLDYSEHGVQLVCEKGKVNGVIVYFHSREHQPFEGKTKEGIGVQSSIRDVICTYGQPTSMSRIRVSKVEKYDEWAGGIRVRLSYPKTGITFIFVDNQLVQVSIAPQRPAYDPAWQQDIGDVTEYRNIVCDTE